MRLFCPLWLFILWLNMDKTLQQNEIKCTVPRIENGYVPGDIKEYRENEILQFECNANYVRTEHRPTKCIKIGSGAEWSPTPICELIKCKVTLPPLEGTRYEPEYRNVFLPGDTLRVICGRKYWIFTLQDTSVETTCRDNGEWTVRPVCQEVTCSNQRDRLVQSWNVYWGQRTTLDTTVRYRCRSGYKSTDGTDVATCTRDGWRPNPFCEEIKCTVPRIENGYVPGDIKEFRENEILQFECNAKYVRTEGRPSKCIKIGSGAEWSPTPICELIKCKVTLPPLEGTRYEPEYRNVFLPGDTLRVICGREYGIFQDTSVETTCRDNGEWTVRPVCQEVTCSNQRDRLVQSWNVYWGQRTTLDTTVRYRCRSGYKSTDGTDVATCTRDGWRPNPFCEEITCDREEVKNAVNLNPDKQIYKYNEQAEYRCKDGYEGRPIRTCGAQGWTGNSQCTEHLRNCGTPPFLVDGDLTSATKSEYSHNESVEYMCPLYYTMEGEPYRTCINGEWTGHMRCLRPCIVNEDDVRQHNITLKSSGNKYFAHDELIEFRCARGTPVGTVAMHQRCNGGVILLPTCQ